MLWLGIQCQVWIALLLWYPEQISAKMKTFCYKIVDSLKWKKKIVNTSSRFDQRQNFTNLDESSRDTNNLDQEKAQ